MNFKGYGNGRPSQYTHEFTVFRRKNKVTAAGRVAKDCEMKTPFVIPDGILAEASQKEQEAWAQNQHPITHTVVSYQPSPGVREKDVLVLMDGRGRRFQVQGIVNPAGNSLYAIYYVLERMDVYGNKCGDEVFPVCRKDQ